ncbi:hypothetical protein PCE1_003680 [Barthelona sp. PCE]
MDPATHLKLTLESIADCIHMEETVILSIPIISQKPIFRHNRWIPDIDNIRKSTITPGKTASENRKWIVFVHTLAIVYNLLEEERYMTKRELYYTHVSLYGTQKCSDKAIQMVSNYLQTCRSQLNIFNAPKGFVAGPIHIDGDSYSGEPRSVPLNPSGMRNVINKAKAMIIIENQATFHALNKTRIKNDFLLVTACGYPDLSTRSFCCNLQRTLGIPAFGLMDCDPDGVQIFLSYKYNPSSRTYYHDYSIQTLKWLQLDTPATLNWRHFTERDIRLVDNLLAREDVCDCDEIQEVLYSMKQSQIKYELQAWISSEHESLDEIVYRALEEAQ